MELRIAVHSMVDVITNSSTVIYTWTNGDKSIAVAKEMIDYILSVAGSDKKAEDLFEFTIDYTEDALESIAEDMLESEEFEELNSMPNETREDWDNQYAKAIEIFRAMSKDQQERYATNYLNFPRNEDLIIKPKDNTDIETLSLCRVFKDIFEQDGTRDG